MRCGLVLVIKLWQIYCRACHRIFFWKCVSMW